MHGHKPCCSNQHGKPAGSLVNPLGNQFTHNLHVTQGMGDHVTHTVAMIVGGRKRAPFFKQLFAQLPGQLTPLAMNKNAPAPGCGNPYHPDHNNQPDITGDLRRTERTIPQAVGNLSEQTRNLCGKEAAGSNQADTRCIDDPVPPDIGTNNQ